MCMNHLVLLFFISGNLCFMQQECNDTSLAIACIQGHIDTAKVLLDHGAIVDHPNAVRSPAKSYYFCNVYMILDRAITTLSGLWM